MCGIVGIVSLSDKSVDTSCIKKMNDKIAHRGPDDGGYAFFLTNAQSTGASGYWSEFSDPLFSKINEHLPVYGGTYYHSEISNYDFKLALGHRRLSILDLSYRGHQPMASPDKKYWIVYNGEIYNFTELKKQLSSKGYIFRTKTDTEVILLLWKEYGEKALAMLNGMFSFALFDKENNKLFLARDRFGVKPLYYSITNNYLLFASEPKAIIESGLISKEISNEGLVEYFSFQNIYSNRTLFKNIFILEPGTYFSCIPGEYSIAEKKPFFSSDFHVDITLKKYDVVNKTSELFQKAVTRQLISDVEVGAYLSGGMDSGSIVAVVRKSIPRLLTFTAGFDLTNVNGIEQGFDERKQAEKLSYLLQTEHYDVVLHAGDMPAAMEQISWHMDDPRVGMCHQNWYVAKLASKFVKVCLSGAGGDELFGGYPWRYLQGIDAQSISDFDNKYFKYWLRLLKENDFKSFFTEDLHKYLDCPYESFRSIMVQAPEIQKDINFTENLIQRMLYFEYKTFMHGFLVTEDRISMAHSLETRVPFLDNDLSEYAWSIPVCMKLNIEDFLKKNKNKYIRSNAGKQILRTAMEDLLPKEFTRMKKQGFSPPDENWFKGPSVEYIKDILLSKKACSRPYFNNSFIEKKLKEHFSGKYNHRLFIWSLLSFEWLQRHYID